MSDVSLQILVQGTADWNQPIATNQHYMVNELSKEFSVTFVESLGLRRPELSVRDLRRALRRLRSASSIVLQRRAVPSGVRIVSPKVIPIHRSPWLRLNRLLLARAIHEWRNASSLRIHWSYSPVTYGFESGADVSVYHCVDLYAEFPGIDRSVVFESEQRLARSGALAIGSSEIVVKHLTNQGFARVLYWPNVADVDRIKASKPTDPANQRSGVIFAGNLSDKKVDFDLLQHLVDKGVELHLAGPVAEGGGNSQKRVNDLVAAGASYHGVLDLDDLAALMHSREVGLIPYRLNAYTAGVSPLKTFEYLAAGLAVVSTEIPAVVPIAEDVFVTNTKSEFEAATQMLSVGVTSQDRERRVMIADAHSWRERGQAARSLVKELSRAIASSNG